MVIGGSFFCGCKSGFAGDGIISCTDIDECVGYSHNCHVRIPLGSNMT